MNSSAIRLRFAPSPTGIMHIGNVRTALLNYLFAKQKGGTFILRIEDTDPQRNFDPGATIIIEDLRWLSLAYDEGPGKGGPYAPYFQSERTNIYQNALQDLIAKKIAYPCFCSLQELEKKRERQRALNVPPRYDRTCLRLSDTDVADRLAQGISHIWRFKIDESKTVEIQDLSRGTIRFDLAHFTDFALTRNDGSFTFIFANAVDDIAMKISHVFRGEDHVSNTANQAVIYQAFHAALPLFWHMPMLCNIEGKKLSKRDFGFSLHDMQKAGFLPQAIVNYLAIVGGSYTPEIMSLAELITTVNFDHPHTTSAIKYDVEKLRWINHQWIQMIDPHELLSMAQPFLKARYPAIHQKDTQIGAILQILKPDFYTLHDTVAALQFYFEPPTLTSAAVTACISPEHQEKITMLVHKALGTLDTPDMFLETLKQEMKKINLPLKELFWFLRLALMGHVNGPSIHELITMLGSQESKNRIEAAVNICLASFL